jgi:hypothetical protein
MTENSSGFAAKFGSKKPSFTQSNILDKAKEQKQSAAPLTQKQADYKTLAQVDPQKKSMADLIYLVKGVDAGRNAWYYVLVERLKVQLFLKALNDDIIHLENYGKILYSAYGDEPPQDITDKLKAEYGIK